MRSGVLAAMLLSGSVGLAQQPHIATHTIFFAPDAERTFALSKGPVRLTTLTVPAGILLAIDYESDEERTPDSAGRFEAHGHVVARLSPGGHFDQMQRLELRMQNAPVVLIGDDVDVVVTR